MTRHPTAEPLASTSGRLAALDLLRLVAALGVVAFHYLFRGSAGEPFLDAGYPELAPFALYGYLGVSLFFAISGFVIAWSAEGRDWIGFATSRFTRLYPGFLIGMTASFLVLFAVGDSRLPVTPEQWAANLVILSPALGQPFVDGVYWSIVLELVFYGWVTLALATGQFQKRPLVLVAGWLLLAAVNEFVIDHPVLRMVFITEYAGWFAGGIVSYQILAKRSPPSASRWLLAGAFLLALATSFRGRSWMLEHYGTALTETQLSLGVVAAFALFLLAVTLGRRVPASKTTLLLGGLTYPLYLLHQNIGYLGLNALTPSMGRWQAVLLVTAAMLTASLLFWKYGETPLRHWLQGRLARLAASGFLRLSPR